MYYDFVRQQKTRCIYITHVAAIDTHRHPHTCGWDILAYTHSSCSYMLAYSCMGAPMEEDWENVQLDVPCLVMYSICIFICIYICIHIHVVWAVLLQLVKPLHRFCWIWSCSSVLWLNEFQSGVFCICSSIYQHVQHNPMMFLICLLQVLDIW